MVDIEGAKKAAAERAVAEHFSTSYTHVGIGSGSTVVYAVQAIAAAKPPSSIRYVPTGAQSEKVIRDAGLTPLAFDTLPDGVLLDVAFDGADEIDDELNCIKGGGACLYQEKLVACRARRFVCIADYRKRQARLLDSWPSIPIEVEPRAAHVVLAALKALGSTNPQIRLTKGSNSDTQTGSGTESKAPLRTDQDNYIVDAPFAPLLLPTDVVAANAAHVAEPGATGHGEKGRWEVRALAREIKLLEGVLSVGIFAGENGIEAQSRGAPAGGEKPVAAYFGMADGSISVQKAGEPRT